MHFAEENGSGSGEEQEVYDSCRRKKTYHRHTAHQIQRLEAFFKDYPHPDENQRLQLSQELGLESRQVKFWFQNKRTQVKTQSERAGNTCLRTENEKIQYENLAIKEALRNVICPSCGGPPFGEEERQHSLHKLRLEHARLKEEHEKISYLLGKYIGKPISKLESFLPTSRSLLLRENQSSALVPDLTCDSLKSHRSSSLLNLKGVPDLEKALILEAAANAFDELIKLVRINEPLWAKNSSDGQFVLHRDSYDKIFPRLNYFKTSSARIESSKASGIVKMSGSQLVDIFLDTSKWMEIFHTVIVTAKTIQVIEPGASGNRHGSLQLMYEQMHILSPLVSPREFYFLRHCRQIEHGNWLIVDMSYDASKDNVPPHSWRLPSGCLIEEMPNGNSKITWIEHVEVDDRTQTHRLYRDLVFSAAAYGAERWIITLRRMCDRFIYLTGETVPFHELGGGVIASPYGRMSTMKLSHRMVKNFCSILSMAGKLDFPQLSEIYNSGVRVSVRNSRELGQPSGMIVCAATSLWLPLQSESVFEFFRDEKTRVQWDVLSNGNPVQEIAHISTGTHPGNCISIIQPFVPSENILILQESWIDPLGGFVIYCPIDTPVMSVAVNGLDPSHIPILPSGFVISESGRGRAGSQSPARRNGQKENGSLLTVAFQIFVSSPVLKQLNMESVATVNTLISSTVQRIKIALNCSGLD